jgi:hypothetical protein
LTLKGKKAGYDYGILFVPIKNPRRDHRQGLELKQFSLVARARFCDYFTPLYPNPLITEKCKFSNKAKSFPKIFA